MCSITLRRVSGSRRPSRNAARVSSEGKPVCSICSTVLPQSDRMPRSVPESPVIVMRGTLCRFSFANQAQPDVLIAVDEEVFDLVAVDAGGFQGRAEAEEELVDALVELLHVEVQGTRDVGHAHGVGEAQF